MSLGGQEGLENPGLNEELCDQHDLGRDLVPLYSALVRPQLASVLGPPLQEGHFGAERCPQKGKEAGEGSGEQI